MVDRTLGMAVAEVLVSPALSTRVFRCLGSGSSSAICQTLNTKLFRSQLHGGPALCLSDPRTGNCERAFRSESVISLRFFFGEENFVGGLIKDTDSIAIFEC